MDALTASEIQEKLEKIPGWKIENGRLTKDFKFKDFTAAFAFMTELAGVAGQMNHHPDWSNSFDKVSISLITHSLNSLTQNDFTFAAAADEAFLRF